MEEAMRLISSVQPRRRRRGSCKWPAARVYGNIACTRHTEQVIPERERERERECGSLATINARHFSTSSCVNNTARILRGISHSFRRPTPISLRARLSEGEETRERMPRACNVSSPEKGTSTYREFNPRRERRLMDRRLFFRVIVGNRTVFLFFISPLGDSLPPGIIGISSFVK